MSKKIAIVLSGCGVFDGAEIHESVLTLLAFLKKGAHVTFFAPDIPQAKVVNHQSNQDSDEKRNVLIESARIARGEISDIKNLKSSDFDALVFPGGFGAALSLCDFAVKGPDASVNPDVEKVILDFYDSKKVIGAMCVAPALIAKVLGHKKITVTIGNEAQMAAAIEKTGAIHKNYSVKEVCIDSKNKILTTPAYMLAQNILEAEVGINQLIDKIIELA